MENNSKGYGGVVNILGLAPDNDLTAFQRSKIEQLVSITMDKISSIVKVYALAVHVTTISKGGHDRYTVRCRISTDLGRFVFSHNGWDIIDTFAGILTNIENKIIHCKGRISSVSRSMKRYEKYSGGCRMSA